LPGSSAARPGSNPPRSGSNPPRSGSNPPGRPGSNPPRPMSTPPTTLPPLKPSSKPPRATLTDQELRALTPEAQALKKQIDDKLKFIDQQNHFDLLGVGRDAQREQIKTAYIQLAKTFHPDRLGQFKLEVLRND